MGLCWHNQWILFPLRTHEIGVQWERQVPSADLFGSADQKFGQVRMAHLGVFLCLIYHQCRPCYRRGLRGSLVQQVLKVALKLRLSQHNQWFKLKARKPYCFGYSVWGIFYLKGRIWSYLERPRNVSWYKIQQLKYWWEGNLNIIFYWYDIIFPDCWFASRNNKQS